MIACVFCCVLVFFFKQKTAYEMRISDWSSDVCSSDLQRLAGCALRRLNEGEERAVALLPAAPGAEHGEIGGRQEEIALRHARVIADAPQVPRRRQGAAVEILVELLPVDIDRPAIEIGRASCRERVGQYV